VASLKHNMVAFDCGITKTQYGSIWLWHH